MKPSVRPYHGAILLGALAVGLAGGPLRAAHKEPREEGRKNPKIVALSTGSMGLGAVSAAFGALAARYVSQRGGAAMPARFIALVGDAELDEGNVWEALLEEAVRELDNLLWVVDVNRQSLDRVVPDARRAQLRDWFRGAGWHVIELRWGGRLRARFARPGGERLRARL